jgi:hypothetical protein
MSARVRIEESGLLFREFDDSDVFEIEKSVLYRALHEGGVKTVEFWLIYDENKLLLVEAKSSSPNPENSEGFELYIAETAEKFVHSISLFASAFMKVLPDAGQEMPEKF